MSEEVEAHPSIFLGEVRCPQSRLLDLLLDLGSQRKNLTPMLHRLVFPAMGPEQLLIGQDVVVDDLGRSKSNVIDALVKSVDRLAIHLQRRALLRSLSTCYHGRKVSESLC